MTGECVISTNNIAGASIGTFGWEGIFTTKYTIDVQEDMCICFFSNTAPCWRYNFKGEILPLVYRRKKKKKKRKKFRKKTETKHIMTFLKKYSNVLRSDKSLAQILIHLDETMIKEKKRKEEMEKIERKKEREKKMKKEEKNGT